MGMQIESWTRNDVWDFNKTGAANKTKKTKCRIGPKRGPLIPFLGIEVIPKKLGHKKGGSLFFIQIGSFPPFFFKDVCLKDEGSPFCPFFCGLRLQARLCVLLRTQEIQTFSSGSPAGCPAVNRILEGVSELKVYVPFSYLKLATFSGC